MTNYVCYLQLITSKKENIVIRKDKVVIKTLCTGSATIKIIKMSVCLFYAGMDFALKYAIVNSAVDILYYDKRTQRISTI